MHYAFFYELINEWMGGIKCNLDIRLTLLDLFFIIEIFVVNILTLFEEHDAE